MQNRWQNKLKAVSQIFCKFKVKFLYTEHN